MASGGALGGMIGRALRGLVDGWLRSKETTRQPSPRPREQPRLKATEPEAATGYPGDFKGKPTITYSPHPGKLPDPGEVVWTWVPYEEDHTQGKDRPALLIGRDGEWLLAVALTSKDHDRDAAQEAREGRHWIDVGSGGWDAKGRPSEIRVNRIIRVNPSEVRRVSVQFPKDRFDEVAAAIQRYA